MANTLANLLPDAYAALDVVSLELVGFIPAVARDSRADQLAIGQSLRSPVAPANSAGLDIVAAMAIPARADQVISNKPFLLTKSRAFPFSWTGEEQLAMDKGPGFLTVQQGQIAQAIRAAVNEIETDLAVAAALGASRATGTAGTTPFAAALGDTAQLRKILDDNGAPMSDRCAVINTTAGANVRTLAQLTKANEAADTSLLRQGTLLDIHGFALRESAKVQSPGIGTGASYTTSTAGHAAGATTINVITGTGTILPGDVITIAGDFVTGSTLQQYIVATGFVGDGTGTITIQAPGLINAVPASAKAITIKAASARNIGFTRNAILLGTRLPAYPREGDLAVDRVTITDARSGLSFDISMYLGFKMVTYHVSIAWGVVVEKNEHVATLLG